MKKLLLLFICIACCIDIFGCDAHLLGSVTVQIVETIITVNGNENEGQ